MCQVSAPSKQCVLHCAPCTLSRTLTRTRSLFIDTRMQRAQREGSRERTAKRERERAQEQIAGCSRRPLETLLAQTLSHSLALTCGHMAAKLFGDLVPHGRGDAAAQVQLVVGVPNLWILLDGLQQLSAIHKGILLGHGYSVRMWMLCGCYAGNSSEGSDGDSDGDCSGRGAQLRPLTSIIGE